MKTQILMVAIATGVTLTAFDVSAHGRNGAGMDRPDFATLDADGNGQLTLEEMQNAGAVRFAQTDTNGDGALSADELSAAATARQTDRITKMIERFDENGDGLLQSSEMPEPGKGGRMGRRLAHAFDHADANNDGSLSQTEFEELGKKGRRGGKGNGRDNN